MGHLVQTRRDGNRIYYLADDDHVRRLAEVALFQAGVPGLASTYGVAKARGSYEPADADLPTENLWSSEKYLRSVPFDPVTESDKTWVLVQPEDPQKGGVYDVKSGAPGKLKDGREFSQL